MYKDMSRIDIPVNPHLLSIYICYCRLCESFVKSIGNVTLCDLLGENLDKNFSIFAIVMKIYTITPAYKYWSYFNFARKMKIEIK